MKVPEPTDNDVPAIVAERLALIGLIDLPDSVSHPEALPVAAHRSDGLFVRGAHGGGSPFLNFLSRWALIVIALALLGGGLGLMLLIRRGHRNASPAPTAQSQVTTTTGTLCSGVASSNDFPAAAAVADVAIGQKQLPSDPATLTHIGAVRNPRSDGGFIDTFSPPGGSIAALYGAGGQLRAVAVRFAVSKSLCDALALTGVVVPQDPTSVVVEAGGRVQAVSPTTGFLGQGGIVRLLTDSSGRVTLLQAEKGTTAK